MPFEPYLGEIMYVAGNFAPRGWAICNGQSLSINANSALFSLLGTFYGGDGVTIFNLPDLRGTVPIGVGNSGTDSYSLGQRGGEEQHALTIEEMPAHGHSLSANTTTAPATNSSVPVAGNSLGQSTGTNSDGDSYAVEIYSDTLDKPVTAAMVVANGSNQPHENRQPFLTVTACIALQGIFPPRN